MRTVASFGSTLRVVAVSVVLALLLEACSGPLRPAPLSALNQPLSQRPAVARVILFDGTHVTVDGAHVQDGQLVGGRSECSGISCSRLDRSVSIPVGMVRRIEVPDARATPDAAPDAGGVMLGVSVGGAFVAVLTLVAWLAFRNESRPPTTPAREWPNHW